MPSVIIRSFGILRRSSFVPFVVALLGVVFLAACGSSGRSGPAYQAPCDTMRAQIKEKQELDAKIKALEKSAKSFRKQGDTASAASAERRLSGLVESQRYLKESLEQSSRDCSPIMQDHPPVLDPALRERQRLER